MIPVRNQIGGLGNILFKEAYILAQMWRGWLPDQYLQSEDYFYEFKDRIKQHFREGIGHVDKVSIHVRRGDYVGHPLYVQLWETDFYSRAMAMFPDQKFMVFSDDIEWCKKQEIFKDCWFSEETEINDFNLMASCKAHIIANSTFSWWAAYIGGGRVVAPKDWFNDGVMRIDLPDEWQKI